MFKRGQQTQAAQQACLHRGLILSRGNVWTFLSEPLTLSLLFVAGIVVGSALSPTIGRNRRVLAEEN